MVDELLTAADVARLRGCHYRTVLRAVESGELPVERRIGRVVLVLRLVAMGWTPRAAGRPPAAAGGAKSARHMPRRSAQLRR